MKSTKHINIALHFTVDIDDAPLLPGSKGKPYRHYSDKDLEVEWKRRQKLLMDTVMSHPEWLQSYLLALTASHLEDFQYEDWMSLLLGDERESRSDVLRPAVDSLHEDDRCLVSEEGSEEVSVDHEDMDDCFRVELHCLQCSMSQGEE